MPSRQDAAILTADFIADVREGLGREGQKFLRSRYLYDAVGSALFEVITLLPEYGLTRADERLLERHVPEMVSGMDPNPLVVELGSGTGTKTRLIVSELARRAPVTYFPIDISSAALERCKLELETIDGVAVQPLAFPYIDGLREVIPRVPGDSQIFLLFLGSTIGNFDRPVALEFLRDIRSNLRPGDVLLLGTDLEKPVPQLLAAYDDPVGVTAAFNRNVLARINRDLGGGFDLAEFLHVALYNPQERRIEMHLAARRDMEVRIEAADLTVEFRKDETIWTESSHKFNPDEVVEMAAGSGFECVRQWIDEEWPFAQNLLVAR